MIRAGIFDVGGVLHANKIYTVYADICEYFGIDIDTFEKAHRPLIKLMSTGKISETDFWQQFQKAIGSDKRLPEESLFLRVFGAESRAHDDVLQLVRHLKEKKYLLAILSNTIRPHVTSLAARGIYDDFPVKVFSNEVGLKKPDPAIYQLTLEKLGVQPNETFFVDDREENIEAANALGIHGILFTDDEKLRQDLEKLGVSV